MNRCRVDATARAPSWTAWVLTLHPDMFPGSLGHSLAGRALEAGVWSLETVDIRSFAHDKHRSVDDVPFGGGPGMVMRPDVLADAIDATRERAERAAAADRGATTANAAVPLIYLSPRGRRFDQSRAGGLAAGAGAVLVCGRFEGNRPTRDRRPRHRGAQSRRLRPVGRRARGAGTDRRRGAALAGRGRHARERDRGQLCGRPARISALHPAQGVAGPAVPDVLLSGHHERIQTWRRAEAERLTKQRRRDLWDRYAVANKIGAD